MQRGTRISLTLDLVRRSFDHVSASPLNGFFRLLVQAPG
jgi:hypothetical protein